MRCHEGQQKYCSSYLGPKMANARGPSVIVREAGTTRSPCAAERRSRRPDSLETDPRSCHLGMEVRASPCRHLCTKAHVLNRIPRYDRSHLRLAESDVQQSEGRIAVVRGEPHKHMIENVGKLESR